ncbi:uncharacterized protein LOC132730104 isoform X2 [Ruditapes philippinarum]|uniref:uncharacterized protein LOC132730104 isoform X2 n=1 Tax=Ruditapes philippinarum TaxID=129788 RepID=UPI00295BCD88|nr:uncharacterized protein LOC132730104 isoform X2 [Ruditapes philippinarum]
MSQIKEYEKSLKDSLADLERKSGTIQSRLREMKDTKDSEEITHHLAELKQLKYRVEEMIKFLENFKGKITDTEVCMYENQEVETRHKTGRSAKDSNNDSGCFSTDSRVLSLSESTPIVQASDDYPSTSENDVTSTRTVTSLHTEPTQHEDTSDPDKIGVDSAC